MQILKKLAGLKTATDYAAAAAGLEAEIATATGRLAELEAGREAAIFSKPDSIAGINSEIIGLRTDLDTLAVALKGARDRHGAAVEAEGVAALEREMSEAGKRAAKLRGQYVEIHTTAARLAALIEAAKPLRREVEEANRKASSAGRGDLKAPLPMTELSRIFGARLIGDPIDSFRMMDYAPPHPDGPALAALAGGR